MKTRWGMAAFAGLFVAAAAAAQPAWAGAGAGAGAGAEAGAGADQRQVTIGDTAESWYSSPPVANCTSPVGCPPVSPPSVYPAGTLHVGEVGGSETARTYIALATGSLPPGSTPVTGALVLPVSSGSDDGNVSVSSASLQLCLVSAPFPNGVSGSTANPPEVDCSVEAPATYRGGSATTFTADLTPFLAAWSGGTPNYGLAIVPAPNEATGTAWHVTFNGRQLTAVPHITATITVASSAGAGSGTGPLGPPVTAPPSSTPATPAPAPSALASGAVAVLPTGSAAPAPPGSPLANPSAASAPGPSFSSPSVGGTPSASTGTPSAGAGSAVPARQTVSVPWLFLWFPLLLVVEVVYVTRTFTSPVSARRRRDLA